MRFERSRALQRCRQIASGVYETRLFPRKTADVTNADGAARQHRRAMFLALMSSARVAELAELFRNELATELTQSRGKERIALDDALQPALTRAACKWAGVPLQAREVARRSKQLLALFDAAGGLPAHFKSRLDRIRAADWAAGLIENVRLGALRPPAHTALREIALHRDLEGQLLSAQTAGAELLNVLRPIVGASVYIQARAHALHQSRGPTERPHAGGQHYMDAIISAAAELLAETIRNNVPPRPI